MKNKYHINVWDYQFDTEGYSDKQALFKAFLKYKLGKSISVMDSKKLWMRFKRDAKVQMVG